MRWLALTLAVASMTVVACSTGSSGRPQGSGDSGGGTGGGAGIGTGTATGTNTGGIIVTGTGTGGAPGTGGSSGGNASDGGLSIPGGEITAVGGPNIVVNGAAKTVQLTASVNGTPVTGIWTTSDTTVGSVGADGVFHANGFVGGTVDVTILVGRGQINVTITVDVDITDNPATLPAAAQTSLIAGGPADPNFKFLYPFDGTVFPRGLPAPVLQFGDGITVTGSADGGIVPNTANGTYLKITTSHFSYQQFGPGSTPVRVLIPEPVWKGATLSAGPNDPMKVAVSKLTGTAVNGPVTESWHIARGALKGFIYYSTYKSPLLPNDPVTNTGGGILRIRPGATTPEIVRRGCIVCHSVSANGGVLTAAIGPDLTNPTSGDAVNLSIATPTPTPRGTPTNIGPQYAFAGLTPDGSLALTNGNPSGLPPLVPHGLLNDYQTILVNTATGAPVASPSLTQLVKHAQGPTFSPDGKHVVFVNGDVPPPQRVLSIMDFDGTSTFSNLRTLRSETETTTNGPASQGASLPPPGPPLPKAIAWPSFTADGSALVYHSGDSFDSAGFDFGSGVGISWPQYAELRLIELDGTVKRLNALNGRNAGGTSVLPYGEALDNNLDYEPTMMPLPVGGYLWVVFTSRRCYGNTWAPGRGVTTQPFDVPAMDPWGSNAGPSPRKKLWVAAIDLNHANATNLDPSHPAFYLPGQEAESANMRAFSALAPCLPESATCESGADCCGGYCRQTSTDASGVPVLQCVPPPANTCSKIDEPCKTPQDCCDATNYCIGGICSLPPPITVQ